MEIGRRTWVFADGDLPPQGDVEPLGHEALMVVNCGDEEAQLTLDFMFEDQEPRRGVALAAILPRRARCYRMDQDLGDEAYRVPPGQFAVMLSSTVPVVAVYGRLDRRVNMAYYPVAAFAV